MPSTYRRHPKTSALPDLGVRPRRGDLVRLDITGISEAQWAVGDRVEALSVPDIARRGARSAVDHVQGQQERLCSPMGRMVALAAAPEAFPAIQAICGLTPIALKQVRARMVEPDLYRATADAVDRTGQAPRLVEHLRMAAQQTERMAMGESLGSGELGVDAAAMWKLATEKLYQNSDLLALATREAMQNSVDAVRMAYRAPSPYRIPRDTGFFSVTLTQDAGKATGTLTFEDNGVGMDETTLRTKFLTLGGTGKSGESGGDVAGGFGMAKAVILGVSPTGRWEVHTRDIGVSPVPGSLRYNVYQMEPRQGTKVVLYDVPMGDHWSRLYRTWLSTTERSKNMLAFSDVPDVELRFNGAQVEPIFPRTKGRYLERFGSDEVSWGEKNEVKLKNYRRPSGSGAGAFYIRLAGLFQFATDPSTGTATLPSDVLIDIVTSNRPQDRAYPLNASRDAWNANSQALHAYESAARELIKEYESAKQPKEWETLLPTSEDAREREGAAEFATALGEVFRDEEFSASLNAALGKVADFYREHAPDAKRESAFAHESKARGSDEPSAEEVYGSWRERPQGSPEYRQGLIGAIKKVQEDAAGELESYSLEQIVTALEDGEPVSSTAASYFLDDVNVLVKRADRGEGGELSIESRQALAEVVSAVAGEATKKWHYDPDPVAIQQKARQINPFGSAGVVKINLTNYDRSEIRRFMAQAKGFIPYLALWDIALRIVASEGGISIKYKPGFVLDHAVRGIATSDGEPGSQNYQSFVMIEPYKLREVIRAHKDRPWAIAAYLHQIASHELTHLPRLGYGHDEKWAIEREDLAAATAHLIPAIERAVITLLKLKVPETRVSREEIRRIREAERARMEERLQKQVEHGVGKRLVKARRTWDKEARARCDEIVAGLQGPLTDLITRLSGLLLYREVREYIRGAGRGLLPVGVTSEQLFQVLDRRPEIAANVLLNLK